MGVNKSPGKGRPHHVKNQLWLALVNACYLKVIGFAQQHTGNGNAVVYNGNGKGIGSVQCFCL
jgi:hypothetical protein